MQKKLERSLKYSQPKFYHFSDCSIKLASFVLSEVKLHQGLRVIDICAGSGVVGLELIQKAKANFSIDFCEIQQEFVTCLKENIKKAGGVNGEVFPIPFDQLSGCYDLILCNPPFFDLGEGRLPTNPKRMMAKYFSVGSFEMLYATFARLFSGAGELFTIGASYKKQQEVSMANKYGFSLKSSQQFKNFNLYRFNSSYFE